MNSNDLEMKSDVLRAIHGILYRYETYFIEDVVSLSYFSQLKNKNGSNTKKTISKILNNQGIPFSFYEIIM